MKTILRRSNGNRRRGSGMLETALLSMIFSAMLIGTFDFGQFLFVHQALVERARSAARWGGLKGGTDLTGTRNMVLYNQSATPSVGTATYFGLEPSMVTVTLDDANTNDKRLTLAIDNYPYKMISPYTAGTYTGPRILVSVPLGNKEY